MQIDVRSLGPGDDEALLAAGALFDHVPDQSASRRFLEDPLHHMLVAYDEAGRPVGFVSGVETTHPDKGTEMFLYELSVDEGIPAPGHRQRARRSARRWRANAAATACGRAPRTTTPPPAPRRPRRRPRRRSARLRRVGLQGDPVAD